MLEMGMINPKKWNFSLGNNDIKDFSYTLNLDMKK